MRSPSPIVLAIVLTMSLLFTAACSSTEEEAPAEGEALQVEEQGGEETNNATEDEFVDENSEQASQQGGENKVPITDDGYDDDWNNMGTQQQQQLKQNNNKNITKNNQSQNYNLNQGEPTQDEPAQYENEPQQAQYEPPLDQEVPQYEPVAEPVANYSAPPPPEPVAAPIVEAPILPEAGTPLIKGEVLPELSELWWVGYDFTDTDGFIRIELVTKGNPKFNIFQERNANDQPELVVRFFDTKLRSKVRRDIDASEFRSPVAYVRMRRNLEEQNIDVIMTMRDAVQPRLYAEAGNILMTFPIPDYYFGNETVGDSPIAQAQILPNAAIMPQFDPGSELPEGLKIAQAYVPDPGANAFSEAPTEGGEQVNTEALPVADYGNEAAAEGMPANFNNYGAEEGADAYAEEGGNAYAEEGGNTYGEEGGNTYGEEGNYGEQGGDNYDYGEQGGDNVDIDTGAANQYEGQDEYEQYQQDQGGENYEQQGNYEEDEQGDEESEYEEDIDNDSLDDYDYDDESGDDIDKFEVRDGSETPYIVRVFHVMAVAQDNYGDNYAGDSEEGGQAGDEYGSDDYEDEAPAQNAGGDGNYGDEGGTDTVDAALDGEGGDFQGTTQQGGNAYETNYGGEDGMFDDGGGDYQAPADTGNAANAGTGNYTEDTSATPANYSGGNAYSTGDTDGTTDYGSTPGGDYSGGDVVGTSQPIPAEGGDSSRRIELDFEEAPLPAVIKTLTEESGVNFILSTAAVNKKVTIRMSGIPFNEALKAILDANGLGLVTISDNLYRIDDLAAIAAAEQSKLAAQKAEMLRQPTQILVHRMSYSRASEASGIVTAMLASISDGDSRVSVQVDPRTNSLIINAPPRTHSTIKALLDRIDMETPQVKISSRIIEVNTTNNDKFGISWGGPINYDQSRGLGFGSLPFPNYMRSRYAIDSGGDDNASAGKFRFFFGSINDVTSLDLLLSMNQTLSNVEILQSSDVVVEDNSAATITAGGSDFFQKPPGSDNVVFGGGAGGAAAAAAGAGGLDQVSYNLTLGVTPRVTADGRVQMQLNLQSETPGEVVPGATAAKESRSITTNLMRRSGETAVIGGVYNTIRQKSSSGVPGLSSLPLIGALFRQTQEIDNKKELMIMVTPTIIGTSGGGGGGGGGGADVVPTAAANYSGGGDAGTDYGGNYSGNNGYSGDYEDASVQGGQGGNYQQGGQGGNYQQGGQGGNYQQGGQGGNYQQGGQGGNYQQGGQGGNYQQGGQGGNYQQGGQGGNYQQGGQGGNYQQGGQGQGNYSGEY